MKKEMIMTNIEMSRRIATIPADRLEQATHLVKEGWGGSSIKIETNLSLKQVNAVFQSVQGRH